MIYYPKSGIKIFRRFIMKKRNLVLYASCIPVKGYTRSLIYCLQEALYYPIPNSLYDLLYVGKGCLDLDKIASELSGSNLTIFNDYVQFLLDKRLAFCTNTPQLFPRLICDWESPSQVTNAIIYIDNSNYTISDLQSIIMQLDDMICQCIELRFKINLSDKILIPILNLFKMSIVESIEILAIGQFNHLKILENNLILKKFPRVKRVTVYNTPEYHKSIIDDAILEWIPESYLESKCGTITHRSLIFSYPFFEEACNYSSCLNRKVCIDATGNVRNCPASKHIWGNVKNSSLQSIITQPRFQNLWKITKESVEVCKYCEFRFACPDCRIHIANMKYYLSHPKYCKYNPFIGKWQHESGFKSIESCGYYDETGKFNLYSSF